MLFLINKTRNNLIELIQTFAGDEDHDVLLIGDAVFYANPSMLEKLTAAGAENIYASRESLETRAVQVPDDCTVVDYDEMVPLVMDDHEKILSI